MWGCRSCGCKAIAADLTHCPHCGIKRKEMTMPRISAAEGPSNALEDSPSAGINSSASERKPGKSGSSPRETESSPQSPAPDAASPSTTDHPKQQEERYTASSTDGSTRETGTSRPGQQSYSGEKQGGGQRPTSKRK